MLNEGNLMNSIKGLSKKCLLVIMDGFGINNQSKLNAISSAQTPTIDRLLRDYPNSLLQPGGELVGLPKGISGNSEVGHMNIGAGRPVRQDLVRINESIEKAEIPSLNAFKKLISSARSGTKRIHLMGLLSDGGVHSHIDHLTYISNILKDDAKDIEIYFHAFMDGRDTAKNIGKKYLKEAQEAGIKISTMQGRSIGMDRDRRWEKIQDCYQTLVGLGPTTDKSPVDYLASEYSEGRFDEFIKPVIFNKSDAIQDGDSIFFLNFRPDRAVQLTQALTLPNFNEFERPIRPNFFLCMTPYIPDDIELPILFNKEHLQGTLTEYLSTLGLRQLKIAETEKYAHVTFFFNGGEKKEFMHEKHILIPSPKEVSTYDKKPEMSAKEVREALCKEIQDDSFDFYVVNFANCDMVGHTGNFNATVEAVEAVDSCIGVLIELCHKNNISVMITADHGNADQMIHEDGTPHTSHSGAKVPFILTHPKLKNISCTENPQSTKSLQDIAPTVVEVLGLDQPPSFEGCPLFL
jgi:2,3-bisphosphoglycerate-independent phosphoglycerate mutase